MILDGVGTTKADMAYWRLRRAIVSHELEGGQPLDEAILSAKFEISRTPLREAFKRLALEKFVIAPPHRTPYVRPFSLTDLQPLYETRLMIEVAVSGLAARRIEEPELRQLEAHIAEMEQAIAMGDVYLTIEADYQFHSQIARGTQNRYLAEAINNLNLSSLPLWYLSFSKLGLQSIGDDHQSMIQRLRSRDRAAMEDLMRGHIHNSHRRVISAFVSGADVVVSLP
jgi:DNA-binding GntR family transcriptional regulator